MGHFQSSRKSGAESHHILKCLGIGAASDGQGLIVPAGGLPVHIQDGDTAECRITGPDGFAFEPLVNPVIDLKIRNK